MLSEMMSRPLDLAAIDWKKPTENLVQPLPRASYDARPRSNKTKPAVPAILHRQHISTYQTHMNRLSVMPSHQD